MAGEWKTIEQRERASRDARRWRNRGMATAGVGASGLGALATHTLSMQHPAGGTTFERMQEPYQWFQPRLPTTQPKGFERIKGQAVHGARTYWGSMGDMGFSTIPRKKGLKLAHGVAGGVLAGGLGVAGTLHGVNRYHQHKIAERRKENRQAKKERVKKSYTLVPTGLRAA